MCELPPRLATMLLFEGDQISKLRTYVDVDEALEDAGLRE